MAYNTTVPIGQLGVFNGNAAVYGGTNTGWVSVDASTSVKSDIECVKDRLDTIEKHLCILTNRDKEIAEKHETLKNAYNEYKVLEKLVLGGGS